MPEITSSRTVPSGGSVLSARAPDAAICSRAETSGRGALPPRRRRRRLLAGADACPEGDPATRLAGSLEEGVSLGLLERRRLLLLILSASFGDLLPVLEDDSRSVLPQPFELIVFTLFVVKDVHHDIEVVEENPALLPFPFPPVGLDPGASKSTFHLFLNGRHLTLVASRADDKVIGDPDERPDLQDDDVLGLFGRDCLSRDEGTLLGLAQCRITSSSPCCPMPLRYNPRSSM